jgi:hypothetical protein
MERDQKCLTNKASYGGSFRNGEKCSFLTTDYKNMIEDDCQITQNITLYENLQGRFLLEISPRTVSIPNNKLYFIIDWM